MRFLCIDVANRHIRVVLFLVGVFLMTSRDFQLKIGDYTTSFSEVETDMYLEKTNRNRIAIVLKAKTIGFNDTCPCERFVALVEGTAPRNNSNAGSRIDYDVILLHEPDEIISPSLIRWVEDSRHRHRVRIVAAPLVASYLNEKINGFRQFPTEKANFVFWIYELHAKKEKYSHYWLVEDDVYFTGRWGDFFEASDAHSGDSDYVSVKFEQNIDHWVDWIVYGCQVNGDICYDYETRMISRTLNNLFRISDQFVTHLLELIFEDELRGHDEANFIVALQKSKNHRLGGRSFTHAQLFSNETTHFHGLDAMGAWSAWTGSPSKAIYSLKGLNKVATSLGFGAWWNKEVAATFPHDWWSKETLTKQSERGLHGARTNLNIARNKIFHPIKCIADPSVGGAALAFAAGVESLESPAVRKLQAACQKDAAF